MISNTMTSPTTSTTSEFAAAPTPRVLYRMRFVLILIVLISFPMGVGNALAWTGQCIGITDGDTIKVLHDGRPEKIGLASVDTPERRQPFGRRARQFASDLVFRKNVRGGSRPGADLSNDL